LAMAKLNGETLVLEWKQSGYRIIWLSYIKLGLIYILYLM
jgi:hypothetical protein